MKINQLVLGCLTALSITSCSNDVQIAENTFIHGKKIYKVIDNELR